MDPVVKTILPLIPWSLQKEFGSVLKPTEWHVFALSFLPPPDSIIRTIGGDNAGLSSNALLSPTARRWVRNCYKNDFTQSLRGNRMAASARDYMTAWLLKLKSDGYTSNPASIRKLRDIEAETNLYFNELARTYELGNELGVDNDREQDMISLLWEFASRGEGGQRPKITKKSALWHIFDIEPEQLESLPEEDVAPLFFSRLLTLVGIGSESPDRRRLKWLVNWVIATHLPADREPKTTPRALGKAMSGGLVRAGHQIRDKETDKVEVQLADPDSALFIKKMETKDELDRIAAKVKFSPGERIVFEGMRRGLRGNSLADFVKEGSISPSSVKVLTNRVSNKLKAAAKS